MIVSFKDEATEKVYQERKPPKFPPDILRRAFAKLQQLDVSQALSDLRVPPGNRLELLQGGRAGQHSIRVNDQCRICFIWTEDDNAAQVEITDYH